MTALKGLRSDIDIVTAMNHPSLFAQFFPGGDSWDIWRVVLKAAYALPMTKQELALLKTVTGDRTPPKQRVKELWVVGGRRGGKDSVTSMIIAFSAALFSDQQKLRPGERASILCLACDRDQAQIILNFTRSYFELIPPFAALVQRETADGFELTNGVDIVVATNSFRSVRGRSILVGVLDEVAFYSSEFSARPDSATYSALRHGMGTLPSSMLIGISSPHKKSGLLFNKWRDHYGKSDDKVLVIHAPTSVLNPTIDPDVIADALEKDPAEARADYLAEWREDLTSFISRELIENAVDRGVTVRPYDKRFRYTSFIDACSGGADSFTCVITHAEGDTKFVDCLVEVIPPLNTANATLHIATVLKGYHLHETMGDFHAAGWVLQEFARHGIAFKPRPTGIDRSVLYLETLPLFSAGRVRLLDNKRLISQYLALERRVLPGGHDKVDHPNRTGNHDDLANSCSGALWRLSAGPPPLKVTAEHLAAIRNWNARGGSGAGGMTQYERLLAANRRAGWDV